jgi:hypothetical protein
MIGTRSLAGQVTVSFFEVDANWALVKCLSGAVGAATLVIVVMPCWSKSASSAPVP